MWFRMPRLQIDTLRRKNLQSDMSMDAAAAVDSSLSLGLGADCGTLIGMVGDFDLAEESAQETFAAAVDQ